MMREVFIVSDNLTSPLGYTTEENFYQLNHNRSGISQHERPDISEKPFYASIFNKQQNEDLVKRTGSNTGYTKFERLIIHSITEALDSAGIDVTAAETIIILSTTKGNIGLLETETDTAHLQKRISLHASAKLIAAHFSNPNHPIIISNACISGLAALLTAKRLLQAGRYRHAIVAGADVISKFIFSGFQSFQAISDQPCKPFDSGRNGITLGEAAGTLVLSSVSRNTENKVKLSGGAVSNDANHISGPSRTGEELGIAIKKSLKEAALGAEDIGFISAHGTATLYNDEMEAKAFAFTHLESAPVNSLKGYYGHTLGSAGIIESIISVHSLLNEIVLPTVGFGKLGVTVNLNISNKRQPVKKAHLLKTASGFGGCNAALVFSKSYS